MFTRVPGQERRCKKRGGGTPGPGPGPTVKRFFLLGKYLSYSYYPHLLNIQVSGTEEWIKCCILTIRAATRSIDPTVV